MRYRMRQGRSCSSRHVWSATERNSGGVRPRSGSRPSDSLEGQIRVLCSGPSDAVWANQNLCRNAQTFVQFTNHLYRQGSTTVEDFGYPSPATDQGLEISSGEAPTLHVVKQRIDGIRRINRFMLRFEALDQHRQDIEAVSRRCPRLGLHESFDLLQHRSMVSLRLDWSNLHDQPQTVLTSTRSYARCVPTNLTQQRWNP